MPRPRRPLARLSVERLDERVVPANNLTVVGSAGATANVATVEDPGSGTIVMTPTGADATLRIADLVAALKRPGFTRVEIATAGTAGAQDGDLVWPAVPEDLDFAGVGTGRALVFRAADDIELTGVRFFANGDAANNVLFAFEAPGDVLFRAGPADGVVFDRRAVAGLTVTAGGSLVYDDAASGAAYAHALGAVTLTAGAAVLNNRGGFDAGGPLTVTAGSVALGTPLAAGGPVVVTGPVTLTRDAAVGRLPGDPRPATPAVTLAGTVDGAFALDLNATTVALQQPVGGITPLAALRLDGGDVGYGANPIRAAAIAVGDGPAFPLATLSGTGPLTGDVTVHLDGTLRPAGAGAVGVLPIAGRLTVNGILGLDLGPSSDRVHVTGDVSLTGWLDAAGFLPGVGDVKVIDFTGTLTGTFANAPAANTSPVLTGADIVTVSHYGPAATGVTVAPYALPFNGVAGSEFDGTGFLTRLTGPGVLGAVRDQSGALVLATHGTTAASKLLVTTTANGSDDVIRLPGVFVHGSLGTLSAPKADATVRADGALGAVVLRTAERLTAGRLGSLKAQAVPGDIAVTQAIGSITSAGGFGGNLTAGSVGTVAVGGLLGSAPADPRRMWAVAGHVGAVTAGAVGRLDLTARSMGTLTVNGRRGAFSGDVTDSAVILTGSLGAARVALKAVKVAGAVTNSLFDIRDGNVGSFTTGRFNTSRLYLGYAPAGAFHTGGTFDADRRGTLGRFTTTAAPLGDPFNPANFAFAGSQVAADTFGVVRLSGLSTANQETAFGLKFATTRGSIRTAGVTGGALPVNVDLDPGQAGDFFLVDG